MSGDADSFEVVTPDLAAYEQVLLGEILAIDAVTDAMVRMIADPLRATAP